MIGTVHLRDKCQRSRHRRHIRHREIGVPEIKGNERSKASKSRRYRDRPSKGQVSKIWSVGIWQIGKSPGECIDASQTPKPRRVVWWWSRDSWSHGPLCSQKGLRSEKRKSGIGGSKYMCSRHRKCRNRDG